MAKPIKLKNRTFNSQKEAKDYFIPKMYELKEHETVVENGSFFDELMEIYELYCQFSGGIYANRYKDVAKFTAKNNLTNLNKDEYATTVCYFIVGKDGQEWDFSILKAISCVSQNQNLNS